MALGDMVEEDRNIVCASRDQPLVRWAIDG